MPTERQEVEVVCNRCNGSGKDPQIGSAGTTQPHKAAPCTTAYGGCGGSGRVTALLPEGSLTEARLRLADAAEAKEKAWAIMQNRISLGIDCTVDEIFLEASLADDRAHIAYDDVLSEIAALRTARGEG